MIRNVFWPFPWMRDELRQMMKNDQHFGNVTIFFFFCEMIKKTAKGQRGTRSHSNMSFLQCAVNGLVSFAAVRSKIFVRLLLFRDIAWEDLQGLRGISEIYSMAAL